METLVDHSVRRLGTLCRVLGFGARAIDQATSTLRELMLPWGGFPVGHNSGWVSDIADDNSPIEFSVAFAEGEPEVRMMIEAQGDGPTLWDQCRAALALNERLARWPRVDLSRFHRIAHLFLPEDFQGGRFALWHSFCFSTRKPPAFKAYFNPQARGAGKAQALVEEALRELGLAPSWPLLARLAAARGPIRDELKYFALDLTDEPAARVKIYFLHHGATPTELDMASQTASGYVPGEALVFSQAMVGGTPALSARPPYTCHAFVGGGGERPHETTLYIPACAYARDDGVVRDRVVRYMRSEGLDAGLYERALTAFDHRPLEVGLGIHSYVSTSRRRGARRIAVYLSPELIRTHAPGSVPAVPAGQGRPWTLEALVQRLRLHAVSHHPFMRGLSMRANDSVALRLLVTNLREGLPPPLRFGQDVWEALEATLPADGRELSLSPGQSLRAELTRLHTSQDEDERLGVLLVSHLASEQFLSALGAPEIPPGERALSLARAMRSERGALSAHSAFWRFLDALYMLSRAVEASPAHPPRHRRAHEDR